MSRAFSTLVPALLLACAALGSPVAAQRGMDAAGTRPVQIGFGGGVSVPTSHAADVFKTGVNGQAFVLLNLGVPLRFNLGYQKFDYKDALLTGGTTTGQSTTLSGVGGIVLSLPTKGPLGAYVTAGLGAFNIKDEVTATAGGSTSESNLNWGVDGGAGITLRLGRLRAFAEGRVQNVYTDKGKIDAKSVTSIPVTFGVIF